MSDKQTTPFGLWRYGNDFMRAATTILINHNEQAFMPYYFLIGQSIELSLKAFLLADGVELEVLHKKYGHKLDQLITLANEHNIQEVVNIKNTHVAVIDLMSKEYNGKRYQYIKTGMMNLPHIPLVHEAGELLSTELKNFCYEADKN